MTTLKQIASEAGVSIRTVSIALNGDPVSARLSDSRVQKIQKIARKRGYRVSAAARAIRFNRTNQIGILVRNDPKQPMLDPSGYETILGINHQLEAYGYVVCLIRYTDVQKQFLSHSRVFDEHMLDGMISIGNISEASSRFIQKSQKNCVWIDNNLCEQWPNSINRDEFQAGWLAAHHVCQLGYRDVFWVGPGPDEANCHFSVKQRYDGVKTRLHQQGIKPEKQILPSHDPLVTPSQIVRMFKKENVLIAYNQENAAAITFLANNLGFRPGYDFGLVCCEEGYYTHRTAWNLSRVSFDRYQMGQKAANMMHKLHQGGDTKPLDPVKIPVHWIAGSTAWGPHHDSERWMNGH